MNRGRKCRYDDGGFFRRDNETRGDYLIRLKNLPQSFDKLTPEEIILHNEEVKNMRKTFKPLLKGEQD